MDDFARAFFALDGDWCVLPYSREDLIGTLSASIPMTGRFLHTSRPSQRAGAARGSNARAIA